MYLNLGDKYSWINYKNILKKNQKNTWNCISPLKYIDNLKGFTCWLELMNHRYTYIITSYISEQMCKYLKY